MNSLNRVNYSNGKSPCSGENFVANSQPLGQSIVVNPPPYPGRTLGVSSDRPITESSKSRVGGIKAAFSCDFCCVKVNLSSISDPQWLNYSDSSINKLIYL